MGFEASGKKVCMHVLTTFSADPRVIRAATALKDAGYAVTVVDIADNSTRVTEDIYGVTVKHVKVSSTFLITRFRQWAIIKALLVFIRSLFLLLGTPADFYHAHDFTALPACYFAALLTVLANSEMRLVLSVNSSEFEHENRIRQHCPITEKTPHL